MIERVIEYSARNRFVIILMYILVIGWGLWAVMRTPLDAIPDLSDNQVIVLTEWPGRGPQVVEDQITYTLAANLQGLPRVKVVRAQSFFGFSLIYVIFEDDVDVYWARTRVLERPNYAQSQLPSGVTPALGPDGTGVGHVFWYTVDSDDHDLGELRAIQDWYIRYQLAAVPGVAEVASIGGFVQQYQIDVDPNKLRAYGVTIPHLVMAVQRSNSDFGGKLIEQADVEYVVRGRGYVQSVEDIEDIVVGATEEGVPIFVKQIATVQLGGDIRRGLLDRDGEGEVVGGIVVMRYGENAKAVIDRVKAKIAELSDGLPSGVSINAAYDRSDLTLAAVNTLKSTLIEEAIIVSIIVLVFLFHFRSALVIVVSLPTAVLVSLIFMYYLKITSNIMSLGGIAIAIGVLVDASVVMVENAYRHLSEGTEEDRAHPIETIIRSAKQVGRPIFFSLVIIVLSFVPVFMLEGQEGRLFSPLAFTKTFAMAGSAIIAITLVPVLMTLLMRGKLKPESSNPISRFFNWLYRPVLSAALRFKKTTLVVTVLVLAATVPIAGRIGSEFMPSLDEGSLLFMPVMLPNVSIIEAKRIMQVQDRIIVAHPEVETVLGKVGRAQTATDPAPVAMIESIIQLKPRDQWRPGITKSDILAELDAQLQIPGVTNGWTQPIINRIQMLATGIRTDLGVKIFGDDLNVLGELAIQVEAVLRTVPGAADLYAERVTGGKFIDIDIDRQAAARYGVRVGDVQMVVETAVGGMNLSTTVEGRERFPIRVRYARGWRDNVDALGRVLVSTPRGEQIPLAQVAAIRVVDGPPMINSENSLLRATVLLNVRGRDMGSFVDEARAALDERIVLPAGYYLSWSGQYENQIRAKRRLQIPIPAVILIVFVLLYFTFHSVSDSLMVILSVPFALVGGILLQSWLGYNFSVAVWVGYIALTGVAVETGVVMLVYLEEALAKKWDAGPVGPDEVRQATFEGAGLRLRPKLMTVATSLIGLLPIMWSDGTGSDVMKPLATPMIGGMFTSTILVLVVLPVIFSLIKESQARRGTLTRSEIGH